MKAPLFKAALFVAGISFLVSCQKDVSNLSVDANLISKAAVGKHVPKTIEIKGEFTSNTGYIVDRDNGGVEGLPVLAWFPGMGEGQMSHFGKFYVIYDQYSEPISWTNPNEATGYSVSLNQHLNAEVDALKMYGIEIPFTGDVKTDPGAIFYDKQGNSFWGTSDYNYRVIEPGHTLVLGYFTVTGGTGKFAGATGSGLVTGHAYWAAAPTEQTYSTDYFKIEGTLTY